MGRRLAMVAVEGDYTSPWLHPNGKEREVRVTGNGTIELVREGRDGRTTTSPLPYGTSTISGMDRVFRYRVTKRAILDDEPTTVEVIY
jgi:hypothetical protein